MPLRSDPSNYSFFLDFEGSQKDANVQEVLEKTEKMSISLKNLGSYPADKGRV
jgi:prephenate dehydratase